MRNLDLIARTEDVHFGLDARSASGWRRLEFGSDRNSLLPDTELNYGWHFSDRQELFAHRTPGLALRGRRAA